MKRAFLTGISGLLGTNLAIDLLQNGFLVTGLIRDKSRYKGISHGNLTIVEGSLDIDLTDSLKHVDIFIHVDLLQSYSK